MKRKSDVEKVYFRVRKLYKKEAKLYKSCSSVFDSVLHGYKLGAYSEVLNVLSEFMEEKENGVQE